MSHDLFHPIKLSIDLKEARMQSHGFRKRLLIWLIVIAVPSRMLRSKTANSEYMTYAYRGVITSSNSSSGISVVADYRRHLVLGLHSSVRPTEKSD